MGDVSVTRPKGEDIGSAGRKNEVMRVAARDPDQKFVAVHRLGPGLRSNQSGEHGAQSGVVIELGAAAANFGIERFNAESPGCRFLLADGVVLGWGEESEEREIIFEF